MTRKIIISLLFISHLLASCCLAEEWFTRRSDKDFKYVNIFIQNISEANYVVVVGDMHNIAGQLHDTRFRLESEDHKKALQSFMTKLDLQEAERPPDTNSKGNIRYVEYDIDIVSVFDGHREHFSFSGSPLMAYLSSKQSFWIDSKKFDEDELYKFLKQTGIRCDEIKYTGNPPQYMPPVILGSWHTENGEVEIEFLNDGTFNIEKSPIDFYTHLNKLPDKFKGFHLISKTGKWRISDDLLSLSLTMGAPLDNGTKGCPIRRLDDKYLVLHFSDYPDINLVRGK